MMLRRSKLETCIDVLNTISKGVTKPTCIMFKANLSWSPMQEYLHFLMDQELIAKNSKGQKVRYEITDKGRRTLNYFRMVEENLSPTVTKRALPHAAGINLTATTLL